MNQPMQPPAPVSPNQGGLMAPKQPVVAPWLLIVFIIVLLGGGGYLGWYFWSQSKAETTVPTTTTTPTTTPKTTTTTPTTTTSTDLTYTNSTYGFTMIFPAAWKGYKFKEATISGSTMTYYVEIPTTDVAATGDSTADAGYYSPFAISVYTLAEWAAVEASEGPKDTLITKNATYAFGWSHANGTPPSDFKLDSDIAGIIASFKLK